MFSAAQSMTDSFADDIGGYAVVVWDREGTLESAFCTAYGAVGAGMVPTMTADALNRHLAGPMGCGNQTDKPPAA